MIDKQDELLLLLIEQVPQLKSLWSWSDGEETYQDNIKLGIVYDLLAKARKHYEHLCEDCGHIYFTNAVELARREERERIFKLLRSKYLGSYAGDSCIMELRYVDFTKRGQALQEEK